MAKTRVSHFISLGLTIGTCPVADELIAAEAEAVRLSRPTMVAFSCVHPGDNYSRSIGREWVYWRLTEAEAGREDGHVKCIPQHILIELLKELRALEAEPLTAPSTLRWAPLLLDFPAGRREVVVNEPSGIFRESVDAVGNYHHEGVDYGPGDGGVA